MHCTLNTVFKNADETIRNRIDPGKAPIRQPLWSQRVWPLWRRCRTSARTSPDPRTLRHGCSRPTRRSAPSGRDTDFLGIVSQLSPRMRTRRRMRSSRGARLRPRLATANANEKLVLRSDCPDMSLSGGRLRPSRRHSDPPTTTNKTS